MPRRSAAALAVAPFSGPRPRLAPPKGLDPAPSAIFRQVVAVMGEGHFSPVDVHLLAQFAEAVSLADMAAKRLRAEGPVVAGKPSAWLPIVEKSWRSAAVLASRLRLCPASRYDARAAGRRATDPPASIYDLMRTEADAHE